MRVVFVWFEWFGVDKTYIHIIARSSWEGSKVVGNSNIRLGNVEIFMMVMILNTVMIFMMKMIFTAVMMKILMMKIT